MKLTEKQKAFLIYEAQSFLTVFVSILTTEYVAFLQPVFNGDLSRPALYALLGALGRVALKASLIVIFPSLKSNK